MEMARSGLRFAGGIQTLANALAPVQVVPVAANNVLGFHNLAQSGNAVTLFFDFLSTFLASGTPAAGKTILVSVFRPEAVPNALAQYSASSLSGANKSSFVRIGTVAVPTGAIWHAVSSDFQLAAANIGQGDTPIDLGGRIAVPTGFCLGVAILSGAGTTPLYGVSAQWVEIDTDMAT